MAWPHCALCCLTLSPPEAAALQTEQSPPPSEGPQSSTLRDRETEAQSSEEAT